jgi:hypothetical protein
MSVLSKAYLIADDIHAAFFPRNNMLRKAELSKSGVMARIGSTSSTTSERIETTGLVEGQLASQTLARDKWDNYHLSTTFLREGGQHVQGDIRPASPVEAVEFIDNTLFMEKLAEIARVRCTS